MFIGIDLGTTNSSISIAVAKDKTAMITTQNIAQLTSAQNTSSLATLPSALYIPHAGEGVENPAIGRWAKDRASEAPDRVIVSAKSWLGQSAINPRDAILPWKSEVTTGKLSPVTASSLVLSKLLVGVPNDAQDIVITVPASFDDSARNLTLEAARQAGIRTPLLLEEPVAAFYSWLYEHETSWRDYVAPGHILLVCDVGGGTTDFSLLYVDEDESGHLSLTRLSVGEHLLLGGDNMDLALAHTVKAELAAKGQSLDHWQFQSLISEVRKAKEVLLSDEVKFEYPISVAGRGSSLFQTTISHHLTKDLVTRVTLDGFFPEVTSDTLPVVKRTLGLTEIGLRYANDPGITRHLAKFLRRSWESARESTQTSESLKNALAAMPNLILPTHILFNGGVFKAEVMRKRLLTLVSSWGQRPITELTGNDLDLSVSRGASYYAWHKKTGQGLRVKTGTSRSYYVAIDSGQPAIPGFDSPVHGLCLIPQGTQAGSEIELPHQEFGLVTGEPAEFTFYSSLERAMDQVGTIVNDADHSLTKSHTLSLTLPSTHSTDVIPVTMTTAMNELGILEVYLNHQSSGEKWRLEFNTRPYES